MNAKAEGVVETGALLQHLLPLAVAAAKAATMLISNTNETIAIFDVNDDDDTRRL